MRESVTVRTVQVDDDSAHYEASIALEEVLAWFRDDGYDEAALLELCESRIEAVMEADE